MDDAVFLHLSRLIRNGRVAALGTLRDGEPLVSMILYAPEPDFSGFVLLASRLAQHTQDFLADPRAGLMISEPDNGTTDPQQLARLSLRGAVRPADPHDTATRDLYLSRFPESSFYLTLGDFAFYQFVPRVARFVAGFAQAYNLVPEHLRKASLPEFDRG